MANDHQHHPSSHANHANHDHQSHGPGQDHSHDHTDASSSSDLNRLAFMATLHCMTGCSIGEILGMVISTWLEWSNLGNTVLAIVLSFIFGYSFTVIPLRRSGLSWKTAGRLALASDTASITTMEIVDNGLMLVIPGAMSAGLATGLFWWSLLLSIVIAAAAAFPVNRYLIARGRGHAVVHQHHHAH